MGKVFYCWHRAGDSVPFYIVEQNGRKLFKRDELGKTEVWVDMAWAELWMRSWESRLCQIDSEVLLKKYPDLNDINPDKAATSDDSTKISPETLDPPDTKD